MNVLLLEDRGAAAFYVTEWLIANGHTVLDAFHPGDAQEHWRNREKTPIDSIILDLHTPVDGLTEQQRNDSEGGLLSGWQWLRGNVLRDTPDMRRRIIIYSDYISNFKRAVAESEYRDIRLIPKRQRSSSADDVTKRLQEIARMPRFIDTRKIKTIS